MLVLVFILAAALHLVYAKISYAHVENPDPYIVLKALTCGILSQVGWVVIIKMSATAQTLFVSSLIYDAIVVFAWLTIALGKVHFDLVSLLGIALTLSGLTILKIKFLAA